MTVLRAIGRTMLSSYFVLSGIRAIRHPEQFVGDAQPLTDRLVPTVKRFAPDQVADFIPEDTTMLIRINGGTQLAGGLALASGKGRRLGAALLAVSLIPSTVARHPFWSRSDPDERVQERQQFVKNVGLLGGVIIAARDTEGKPGLAWRANEGRELAVRRTKRARKAAKKALSQNHRKDTAVAAIGSGLVSVGEALGEAVEELVAEGQKVREQAGKRAAGTQKAARKAAKKNVKKLQKSADKMQKRASDAAHDAGKSVRKLTGDARSRLDNIQLVGQK